MNDEKHAVEASRSNELLDRPQPERAARDTRSDEAIEMLRCAEINCDNIKRGGLMFVDMVKFQISEAIKFLESEAV